MPIFISPQHTIDGALALVRRQLEPTMNVSPLGVEITITPHKKKRSYQQNRLLHAVIQNVIRFYHETGFMPNGAHRREMYIDGMKNYWKDRWAIKHSSNLSTKECKEFVDFIQNEMVEQTGGEYQIIDPDEAYLNSIGGF